MIIRIHVCLFTNKLTLLLRPLIAELEGRGKYGESVYLVAISQECTADIYYHLHDSLAQVEDFTKSSLRPLSVQQIITNPPSYLNPNVVTFT